MRFTPHLGDRMSDRRPAASSFARVACPASRIVRPLGIAALLLVGFAPFLPKLAAAPEAAAGGPYTLTISGSVMLRGDNSTASPGSITGYAWDVDGDGNFGELSGATPVLPWSRFPLAVGSHTIALRVTDSGGQTHTASATMNVVASPLVVHDQFRNGYEFNRPQPGQDGRLYWICGNSKVGEDWVEGAVWRMDHDGTSLEPIHLFMSVLEGYGLAGSLLRGTDGTLYGTFLDEGPSRAGSLWKLGSDGTGYAVVHAFREALDGWQPEVPVFGGDGRLYGTALWGGEDINNYGTIWRVNVDGTGFTTLHHFNPDTTGGARPGRPVLGTDGRIYGFTEFGTLWRINPDGTGYLQLHEFAGLGASPRSVNFGAYGMIYGASMSRMPGQNGDGVIWRIKNDGTAFQILRVFDNQLENLAIPAPVFGPDGRLYGATTDGGAHAAGTLWRMNADGSGFTVLYEFNPATGPSIPGSPQFGADGRLWGSTLLGGSHDAGVIYAWSPDPALQSFGNGSFESGFNGWLATGNQRLSSTAGHATDGTHAVVFNSGNTAPNGSVSKTFATVAGQAYVLRFDAGVLAYNRNTQRLEVTARGDSPLLTHVVSISGLGGGAIRWTAQSLPFLADSTATTLVFRDVSATTNSLDLLLDHVRLESAAQPSLTNGSFESGYTGWSASGNQTVATNAVRATDGTRFIVFNNGNTTPNGVLTQRVSTVPGQLCTLRFDVGVLAFNRNTQRLQVTAAGNSPLWSQVISVTGAGGGTVRWTPQTHSFVPDSATTTLTFRDVSTTTNALDLLLDHVRIE